MDVSLIGVDPDLFEEFYREHVSGVERFIARRVGDAHLVGDLTAETFIAAMGSARRFDARRGEPRAWLYGIAYRIVAADARREARAWRAHARHARRDLSADAIHDLEERLDAEQDARVARAAWSKLHAADREILQLRVIDELSPSQIAQVLRIKPGTVRVRLHRAHSRLRMHFSAATGLDAVPASIS